MPLVLKKPAKAKKETEAKNERFENTAFKTGVFGFKRTQVNLFINSLKKQIRTLEKEKENLIVESGTIDGSERQRLTEQYERQILDLSEKLNSEKNTSAMLEKECMRLQGEIENLNIRLVKKGGGDVSESGDMAATRAYLSSSLTKKLNRINEEISRIKNEFTVDENELIFSLPEDKSPYSEGFNGMKFEYTPEKKQTGEESLLISDINDNYGNIAEIPNEIIAAETVFESPADEFGNDSFASDIISGSDTIDEPFAADKKTEPFIANREKSEPVVKETRSAVEIMPSTKLYEQSENSFDDILMNSDKVENDDSFADILFQKTNEYKHKGDDLIAVNPEARDYGDDLIAGNPAAVDKGNDLDSDVYGLYVNDSNIMIDDDNKFYSGKYDDDDYDDISPDVSNLGFIGISEMSEPKMSFARANRRKNIADDIGMSSSVDISDFLI